MKKLLLILAAGLFSLASCQNNKPLKTIEDLKAAFKGESTASAKYAAYAVKAAAEGYDNIAKLFHAASKAEAIHAANHRKVLEGLDQQPESFTPVFEVKSTPENLRDAVDGETYEYETMYPKFIENAKLQGISNAVKSFSQAADTEKKHRLFYQNALDALQGKSEKNLPARYYVCPVCGNTYDAELTSPKCDFCQTLKDKFIAI